MTKWLYEYVKEQIEKKGCVLLSKEYKGCFDKLDIICNKGHKYKTPWTIFQGGGKCPVCSMKNKVKNKLKDFFYITKEYVENEGFILLSTKDDYKGNCSKLKAICPNGHKLNICWSEFRRGARCAICSGVKKKTIEEVKKYIESFGYECLSKVYINWISRLKFKCPKGHLYTTTWASFQQGARCPECGKARMTLKMSGPKGGISGDPYCHEWTPAF